jgi:hypothetical protein
MARRVGGPNRDNGDKLCEGLVMEDQHRIDTTTISPRPDARVDQVLTQVRQALAGLQYGQIAITVQDGVVIQIERIERVRFNRGSK